MIRSPFGGGGLGALISGVFDRKVVMFLSLFRKAATTLNGFGLKWRVGLIASSLVLIVSVPMATAGVEAKPTVKLITLDSLIIASGSHFQAGEALTVRATVQGGAGETTIEATSAGRFAVAFDPPEAFSGPVTVTAKGVTSLATESINVSPSDANGEPTPPSNPTPPAEAPATPTTTTTTTPTTPASKATTTPPPSTGTGGTAMPVGDLPGWKQIFTEDFTSPLALGAWPGTYSAKWGSYNNTGDTKNTGIYRNEILSVANGTLDMYLHTANGEAKVAAPIPKLFPGKDAWTGQTFGRYSVRFKADPVQGYKTAWLLWPQTGKWTAEIDFPEGELTGAMHGFNHCLGSNSSKTCGSFRTNVKYTDWHIATTEWSPNGVSFYLDGKLLGTDTSAVPKEPMVWVLQTETDFAKPPAGAAGHVLVDWVTAYSYAG